MNHRRVHGLGTWSAARVWAAVAFVLLLMPVEVRAQAAAPALTTIEIVSDDAGRHFPVDGRDSMMLGMN